MTDTTRINSYRTAVINSFEKLLPKLRECKPQFGRFNLDELETGNIRVPALRFGVLNAKVRHASNGQSEAEMNCAAFVITEGNARDEEAWAISEAISVHLHSSQMFELVQISAPSDMAILPVVTGKLKAKGVSIIAVEWKQTIRQLGKDIFDVNGQLLEGLYINDEKIEAGNA